MCGLVGIISCEKPIKLETLSCGINSLHHRGPDSMGHWISDDRRIALGHTRLSVIDTDGGNQPLKSADNSITAVVNGELYEFKKIKDELKRKNYRFKTNSDSEIIIALYQEYGENLFSHLRGEFSFILWDARNRKLIAARDRFGTKPLFYSRLKNVYYFSSEIKSLISMGIDAKWNYSKVLQLETETSPANKTIFENIYSVKPGNYISVRENSSFECCYWDLIFPKSEKLKQSKRTDEQEYIKEFSRLFEESVKIRLHADTPIACYLSGGIDSCSILGTMSLYMKNPIDTFTLSFPNNNNYDEYKKSKKMADFVGANHHVVEADYQSIADNFIDCVWHNESTIANTSPVAKLILSKSVKEHGYKVALTGEGSDEIFAGYAPFLMDFYDYDQSSGSKINTIQNKIYNIKLDENINFDYIKDKLNYVPHFLKAFCSRSHLFELVRSKEFSKFSERKIFGKDLLESINVDNIIGIDQLNKSLYLWSKSMLPNVMLSAMGDRMEMRNSVESRLPFLDHKLVEFSTHLPTNMKIKNGIEKYILKESRKNLVHESILNQRKQPFVAPDIIYKDNHVLCMMKEIFNSSILEELPFYDKKKVLSMLNTKNIIKHEVRPTVDMMLTHILSLCVLQNLFKIS